MRIPALLVFCIPFCAYAQRPSVPVETLAVGIPTGGTREVELTFSRIPAGTFLMGNTGTGRDYAYSWCGLECEKPRHAVEFAESFYLGRTEVTQEQWTALMGNWPPEPADTRFGEGAAYPAYYVSWYDAQAFIDRLNLVISGSVRLPSEAEWEYACRGSDRNPHRYAPFSFGDDPSCDLNGCLPGCILFPRYMVYSCVSGHPGAGPVASRLPNEYGLYDLHGNVCEWMQDFWHDDYTGAPDDGSAWLDPPHHARVVRGGYWNYGATACRTAYRAWLPPTRRDIHTGFRLVHELPSAEDQTPDK